MLEMAARLRSSANLTGVRSCPAVPSWLSSELVAGIDLRELAHPEPSEHLAIHQLGTMLGCEMVAYRGDATGAPGGLCHRYQAAELADEEIQVLLELENSLRGMRLVAYRSPPRLLEG